MKLLSAVLILCVLGCKPETPVKLTESPIIDDGSCTFPSTTQIQFDAYDNEGSVTDGNAASVGTLNDQTSDYYLVLTAGQTTPTVIDKSTGLVWVEPSTNVTYNDSACTHVRGGPARWRGPSMGATYRGAFFRILDAPHYGSTWFYNESQFAGADYTGTFYMKKSTGECYQCQGTFPNYTPYDGYGVEQTTAYQLPFTIN